VQQRFHPDEINATKISLDRQGKHLTGQVGQVGQAGQAGFTGFVG